MVFGFFGAGGASTIVFTVAIVVSFFGGNMMMAVEFSCMANAITYQEYKKGESAKAFIMGTIQWCPNIGKMFQGAIAGFGLAAIGYSKTVEVVTGTMVQGITFMTFMVPGHRHGHLLHSLLLHASSELVPDGGSGSRFAGPQGRIARPKSTSAP